MRFPVVSFSASGCHGNLLRSTWMTLFMMRKTYKLMSACVNEEVISNNLCTSLLRLTVIMFLRWCGLILRWRFPMQNELMIVSSVMNTNTKSYVKISISSISSLQFSKLTWSQIILGTALNYPWKNCARILYCASVFKTTSF